MRRLANDRTRNLALSLGILTLMLAPAGAQSAINWKTAAPIPLRVDATDLPRRLVNTEMTFPAQPGPMDFYFVEWTPGNHNPSGPVQNLVKLFFEDDRGETLRWERDPRDIVRFTVHAPDGARSITVRFTYIASQPSVNSRSTDTYGEPTLGAINWNTVLLYPADASKFDVRYSPTLRMPRGWSFASALGVERARSNTATFATVSLAELVDSPVILGEHLRTYSIPAPGLAPHFIDVVAQREKQTKINDDVLEAVGRMLVEAEGVFGPFARDEYHFLLVASDDTPGFGVEHDRSTFIGLSGDALVKANKDGAAGLGVMPHEYTHAWNGKLRAPKGLHSTNYHDDMDAEMLWVYEGMTSYYDEVLAVRSGMQKYDRFVQNLANSVVRYEQQGGRLWRSVADTARGMRVLRTPSPAWADLRRRQDYYGEGALFWASADAIIRRGTNGARSLDDFTRRFFRVTPGPRGSHIEYTRSDVIDGLRAVYAGEDWDALITTMIDQPVRDLHIGLPALLGRKLIYSDTPTDRQKRDEARGGGVNLRSSLGVTVDKEGVITSIVPSSSADQAKLAYGMKIIAISDERFTPAALREAVADTPETGAVSLLVDFGGSVEERRVSYRDGLRYPVLKRDENAGPDLLPAIGRQ